MPGSKTSAARHILKFNFKLTGEERVIGSRELFKNESNRPDPGGSDPQDISADTIGAYLQQRRITSNIGLDEVSEATGISLGVLKALEADDREQLPAEIYLRAFYKKYANFLGLDSEGILAKYEQQPLKQKRTRNRYNFSTVVTLKDRDENMLAGMGSKMVIAVIIILGGVLLYWIYKNYLAPYNPFDFF